jgi:serine/threonine protein kinase
MLVMEFMEHGSLYDLLHNETMYLDGEMMLPILCDISQGLRFLHSANPQVLHGDLKAANILVDSRFRAKVADFGLSQKKNLGGGVGTVRRYIENGEFFSKLGHF